MVVPNTSFELGVQDLELIEAALINELSSPKRDEASKKRIHSLLGKLHSQKNWYRPEDLYIGG